ncbi:hypothetical protein EGT29_21265 [Pigmentiphaga sp. H8]|uniref:type II toxin-antitoxin system YhaV family toxin n=1 Tax=Pigmentiphaga sp. H8 TaxID=2488560 RepID=UPI000F5B57FA|nr:type II toxin-antitoxin system YhaV family toxin [Pigmentiphaga sp. H8]AZG10193.1 hypothetical protein EGT29_21265 [Pigmentiphaga sp. H8]
MTAESSVLVTVNGWTIYLHPLFRAQLDSLQKQVESLKRKDPDGFQRRNATKRLAAIARLAFEIIPQAVSYSSFNCSIWNS